MTAPLCSTRRRNAAMRKVLLRASRGLRAGAGRPETLLGVGNDLHRLAERFDEVYDKAVWEAVGRELDRWIHAAGWDRLDTLSDIDCP
jgi:hypothetical protein